MTHRRAWYPPERFTYFLRHRLRPEEIYSRRFAPMTEEASDGDRTRVPQPTLTVCVVDDDRGIRTTLSKLFARAGFEPRCFAGVDEARLDINRRGLTRHPVDVVLLDMRLEPDRRAPARRRSCSRRSFAVSRNPKSS